MQLQSLFALFVLSGVAIATTISWDPIYDQSSQSFATVACSDGSNGFLTKGFPTFGSVPNFPRIGGAAAIEGWNSEACGSCWNLSFQGRTITVLAVDHAEDGFNISEEAMDELTDGQAVQFGSIDATVQPVDKSACGL
ncbi:SnodProt1 [Abortiporus biennis]|nr:SnodProt1 [Abortiporus biennis]